MRKGTKALAPYKPEKTPRFQREKLPYTPDALLDNLMPTLTEDQRCYIEGHMTELRSKLAKKLGIPKIQLVHYLERVKSG